MGRCYRAKMFVMAPVRKLAGSAGGGVFCVLCVVCMCVFCVCVPSSLLQSLLYLRPNRDILQDDDSNRSSSLSLDRLHRERDSSTPLEDDDLAVVQTVLGCVGA